MAKAIESSFKFDKREEVIRILKEIVRLDPNNKSVRSALATFEESTRRQREQIEARETAEKAVGEMSAYANSQLFEEVYQAVTSNNPIMGTALLRLLSTREDLSLSDTLIYWYPTY